MSTPLAYHLTWTTYGTWLHGDDRGWVVRTEYGIKPGDKELHSHRRSELSDEVVLLDTDQKFLVDATIREVVAYRGWELHALNVRGNHCHMVVTAPIHPDIVMEQFKAWTSRRLSEQLGRKRKWWTRHGSTKWINDEVYFENAIRYVNEGQTKHQADA